MNLVTPDGSGSVPQLPGTDPATGFPTAGLDLPASPQAAWQARHAVADILASWRLRDAELLDDAVLVTSELVTNAVLHGRAPARLELRLEGGTLLISVSDGSSALPRQRRPETGGEVGRGLVILGVLAQSWGVDPAPAGGKRVWARLSVPDGRRAGG